MTLILSCLAPQFVMQVSDRRLTASHKRGRVYPLLEDDRNKALLIHRNVIFAFTGLAEIDGRPTIEWLMDVLKPFVDKHDLMRGMAEVATQASSLFAKMPHPTKVKLHTFVSVGWKQNRRSKFIFPVAARITNAYDDQGRPLSEARSEFVIQERRLRRVNDVEVLSEGVIVPTSDLRRLGRILKRRHFMDSPRAAAHVLVRALRRIATENREARIGENVTVTCLPRNVIKADFHSIIGPPSRTSASTFVIPKRGTRQVLRSAAMLKPGFPIFLSDVGLELPEPADGSDPYSEWR